jgi:Domain of unknown function (DUF6321)
MGKSSRAPWKRGNPRKASGKASKHLSPKEKATAKARARRAGRRYPNLVDNMKVAAAKKKSMKKSTTKKKSASKKSAKKKTLKKSGRKKAAAKKSGRKSSAVQREKDPRGGLTAVGRKKFAATQGSHLRPGVTKKASEMTPADMRRKGSWAVRFYGRKPLPPLLDEQGRPTRLALSAHAWGEPVPRTPAAARKIAAKGKRLLARYRKTIMARRG